MTLNEIELLTIMRDIRDSLSTIACFLFVLVVVSVARILIEK